MEVIKEPWENDELPKINISCTGMGFSNKGCGRLLSASFYDIHSGVHNNCYDGNETYYYIQCPVCGAKTEVYKSGLPSNIRNLI